jgi:hypothetical protein
MMEGMFSQCDAQKGTHMFLSGIAENNFQNNEIREQLDKARRAFMVLPDGISDYLVDLIYTQFDNLSENWAMIEEIFTTLAQPDAAEKWF